MGGISDDNCLLYVSHGISDDNCLLCVDPKTSTRGCATLEAVFEAYDFRLEFDGRTEDFVDRFEARFKEFTKHVLKSYREYRYHDEYYAGCLESMIGDFKLQECPYKRVVTATNPYSTLFRPTIDGRRLI